MMLGGLPDLEEIRAGAPGAVGGPGFIVGGENDGEHR